MVYLVLVKEGVVHGCPKRFDASEVAALKGKGFRDTNYRDYDPAVEKVSGVVVGEEVVTYFYADVTEGDVLADYKERRKRFIKIEFHRVLREGFVAPSVGFRMDCQQEDVVNLQLRQQHNEEFPSPLATLHLRAYDNSIHTIESGVLVTVISEIITYVLGLREHKWALEASIDAATTREEVKAVVW